MSIRKVLVVVLVVVVIFILGVWYIFYGPKPLPKLPSDEEVKAQTSNWPEYVNESYGFKVKVPPNTIEASFGYDGVAFTYDGESNKEEENFECIIYAWTLETELFSDKNVNWKETVYINGQRAERRHVIKSTIYDFEYIVIEGNNFIYELEAGPNSKGFGYRKTCELIFSTFEIFD